MALHLYNTLTRRKEPFVPLQPGRVKTALSPTPRLTLSGYVRAILLAGPECLFLYVSPMLANT